MYPLQLNQESLWQTSFHFEQVKCLIVCRGPVRMEAIKILEAMNVDYGILLSEKDSIVYPQTLAPELRWLKERRQKVHHVPDYMGFSRDERTQRISEILDICERHNYNHLFAGYGFMSEDAEFVGAVESADIQFVGPSSKVMRRASSKDEAKQLARQLGISVIPGEDRICALTLLRKAGDTAHEQFKKWIEFHRLPVSEGMETTPLTEQAVELLRAASEEEVELISISEIQAEARLQVERLWKVYPGKKIRFKHVDGGGGKGQRVITHIEDVAKAVMELLIESKATGPSANKNFLIEVNIENTRHNEIQLLGNGSWCIELGGRDCSLQMHEQKLQEVSLTVEMLEEAILDYQARDKSEQALVLQSDLEVLRSMSQQAEDFGIALGLDSVSTFECIVEEDSHYFMEVNPRIQVEHRITEMVYSLDFVNPENSEDHFVCESLIAAMLLIACHGERLPRPERKLQNTASVETRINASNAALYPQAGGILRYWSEPGPDETRDDQGIGLNNPDTGLLQPYHLAGAYDSNVALSITYGVSRQQCLEKMAEVLRRMELRGTELHINTAFHYGLILWILGQDPMLKPNTRFVQSYLALAGALVEQTQRVNLELAWSHLLEKVSAEYGPEVQKLFTKKKTMLLRPLDLLFQEPHHLMGWLAPREEQRWDHQGGHFRMLRNPLEVLAELYHFLHLEPQPGASPTEQIWENDRILLERGLDFYRQLKHRLGQQEINWQELQNLLEQPKPPWPLNPREGPELWEQIQASHRGFQLGLDLLKLPVTLGEKVNYHDLRSNGQLEVEVPDEFRDPNTIEILVSHLAPPPPNSGNKVVSWTGGTFYSRETPHSEPFVKLGDHVEPGDVLGLLEVMKMFNPVRAEYSGTIRGICIEGSLGVNVTRGQQLFYLEPDIPVRRESDEERLIQERETTLGLMK